MNHPSTTEIIDIHSHIYPDCYLKSLEARTVYPRIIRSGNDRMFDIFPPEIGGGSGRPMSPAFWDLDEKLAFMDRTGINHSVVSLGNPWINHLPGREGSQLTRQINIELASYRERTAGRVIGMGALPAAPSKRQPGNWVSSPLPSGLWG